MDARLKSLLKTIKLNESLLSVIFGMVTVILIGILVIRAYRANKPTISQEGQQTSQPSPTEMVGKVAVETKDGQKYPASLPETYTVQKGDHLWKIAESQYGSGYNWVDIAKENNLKNPGVISAGQELKLPKVAVKLAGNVKVTSTSKANQISGTSYTVIKGDNLWNIAVRAYNDGYKWPEIAKANNLKNPGVIEVGQILTLPR